VSSRVIKVTRVVSEAEYSRILER